MDRLSKVEPLYCAFAATYDASVLSGVFDLSCQIGDMSRVVDRPGDSILGKEKVYLRLAVSR
jgi:hypothetical protein